MNELQLQLNALYMTTLFTGILLVGTFLVVHAPEVKMRFKALLIIALMVCAIASSRYHQSLDFTLARTPIKQGERIQ